MIFDEPTSGVGSWADEDWLRRFQSLATDRTAIVISHRVITAMQANVIHVMGGGRVVESGSHSELLLQEGAYAQSWRIQIRVEQNAQSRKVSCQTHLQ